MKPSIEQHPDEMDATREAMERCYPQDEDEMLFAAMRRQAAGSIEDHFEIDESERTVPVECDEREIASEYWEY